MADTREEGGNYTPAFHSRVFFPSALKKKKIMKKSECVWKKS